ncbi:transmembrane protein C20orf108 [Xenopus laevis]|uniref:MGC83126 protein n=1 Tax=Xenopus laevis TaxID=8355 RepID=Q6DFH7_XENLA|nr:transmembrane protein C20orf108 [Xenopus laevis]AAH76760.1 MGC83126 protein [Xenopus laevis]
MQAVLLPRLWLRCSVPTLPRLLGRSGRYSVGVRPDLLCEAGTVRLSLQLGTLSPAGGLMLRASSAGSGPSQVPQNPPSGETSGSSNENEEKPNKTKQLRKVFKEYGAVAVSFHVAISLVSLGIFYGIVSSGIDITSLLLKVGFSEAVVQSKLAAGTSTFVLAYAIHKLFAPARISITLVSVPFIVRYLRKVGLFKPPI